MSKKEQRLRGKGNSFRKMSPVVAFIFAALSGIGAITFGSRMIKGLDQIMDSKKVPSTTEDCGVLGFFAFLGLCAYGMTILFQVSHKRVVDYLYEKES